MPPIVAIVGYSKSGKTTLLEKIIPVLKNKGYRIGTIKHSHHDVDIDQRGKDSFRHKKAGAETVIVASVKSLVMIKNDADDKLSTLVKYFTDMNLILAEGFKNRGVPKIEVFRPEIHEKPVCTEDENLIALVTDVNIPAAVPVFHSSNIEGLVELIEENIIKTAR